MPPIEQTNMVWKAFELFGFPAGLVLLLIGFGWVVGRGIMSELGRLTRAVTLIVLAMQFLPTGFHEEAAALYEESLDAAKKRKEDVSHERQRKKQ